MHSCKAYTHSVIQNEVGFVCTNVFIIIVFLSALLLSIAVSLHRKTTLVSFQAGAFRAGLRANNSLNLALNVLEVGDKLEQTPSTVESCKSLVFADQSSHLVSVQCKGLSKLAVRKRSALVSVQNGYLRPYWGALEQLLPKVRSSCKWTTASPETSLGTRTRSLRTCHSLLSPIQDSAFMPGNLELNQELVIKDLRKQDMIIAVRGETDLNSKLVLRNNTNAFIQIISAGNISIHSLEAEKNSSLNILLHSAFGKVVITNPISGFSLCQKESDSSVPRLTVEAKDGISIAGKHLEGVSSYGCEFSRESRYWPRLKVLGKPLNKQNIVYY